MALLACRECGGVIAETARVCPHCGGPTPLDRPWFWGRVARVGALWLAVALGPALIEGGARGAGWIAWVVAGVAVLWWSVPAWPAGTPIAPARPVPDRPGPTDAEPPP